MPTDPTQSFSDQLRQQRETMQRDALDAIRALVSTAASLALKDGVTALTQDAMGLESETFKMIVMGRFKNGKSTLLNALMGGTTKPVSLGGAQGPMVVDDLPATAVLSEVNYADVPFIKAWKMNGHAEQWTLAQYIHDSTLGDDNAENERRFREIRQFEIGFPARLCDSKVTLYDSPGLDENAMRTTITMGAVRRCDTALMVYGSRALMGESELTDDDRVRNDGTHVFVVVNLFDGRQLDDRLRGYVWNKYVRDHLHGPDWAGQDLTDYDIYFVNARMAADSRYNLTGPAADQAYRDSGLAAFEQRLARFLIHDRFTIHLSGFAKKAIGDSDPILKFVSQRQAAVAADRDSFRAAWQKLEPELPKLQARPARLPRIIDRYRSDAGIELTSGFTALVAGIRRDLPDHMERVKLPTEETKTFAVWHQKKLMEESVAAINSLISRRISDWSENEADKLLHDIADRLHQEVSDEVADLGRRFDAINMELTGWESAAIGMPGNVHSTTERIGAAIAGLLFGDLSAAVVGGQGGWRGALGGILGAGAASWLLIGVLGITSGIVFVPILAIAALVGAAAGSSGLVARIKKKAVAAADEQLALLPSEVSVMISNDIKERFAKLEAAITNDVTAFIDDQVRNIQAQVQIKQQEEADQERTLRDLKAVEQDVLRHRKRLENTRVKAKQA